MESKEARHRKRTDLASSSQFLMIAVVAAIALLVLAVWHPWATRPVNGVQQSDVATARP